MVKETMKPEIAEPAGPFGLDMTMVSAIGTILAGSLEQIAKCISAENGGVELRIGAPSVAAFCSTIQAEFNRSAASAALGCREAELERARDAAANAGQRIADLEEKMQEMRVTSLSRDRLFADQALELGRIRKELGELR